MASKHPSWLVEFLSRYEMWYSNGNKTSTTWKKTLEYIIMILYDSVYIYHWLFITTCWYYWLSSYSFCCSLLFLCCLLFLHNFSLSSNNHHGIWLSVITVQWNRAKLHTKLIFVAPTTNYKNCSTDLSVPTFSTAGFFHTSKIWFRENSTFIANILAVPVSTHSTTSHLAPGAEVHGIDPSCASRSNHVDHPRKFVRFLAERNGPTSAPVVAAIVECLSPSFGLYTACHTKHQFKMRCCIMSAWRAHKV